ncbi:MAG: septum formation initiator family protein [Firmicutes bacterium]|nr:septum formation initiator family protein [Bacillota bacterium]
MASRTRNKRNMSAGRIAMTIVVVGLLIGIAVVVRNIIGLSIEKRELEKQQRELADKRDELTAELENVNDLDYIEEQARKLLHMIKPGEILYILNGSEQPKDESKDTDIELPSQPYSNSNEEEPSEGENSEENSEGNSEEHYEEERGESEAEYEESQEEAVSEENSEESASEESFDGEEGSAGSEDGSSEGEGDEGSDG